MNAQVTCDMTGQSSGGGQKKETAPTAPSINLPKGGGAIKGIGEKFSVNPVNGTGTMTVPILTSPGRSDLYPKLSLSYDSGSGNGPFGFGEGVVVLDGRPLCPVLGA